MTRVLFLTACLGLVAWPLSSQVAAPTPPVTTQDTNDRLLRQQLAKIAGRETEPAGKVFANVRHMTTVPARTFLEIMDGGYSRALGVACTHCHEETDFASDAKRPKKAAREMQALHRGINDQLITLQHLDIPADQRYISCSTCHRGAINPRDVPRTFR